MPSGGAVRSPRPVHPVGALHAPLPACPLRCPADFEVTVKCIFLLVLIPEDSLGGGLRSCTSGRHGTTQQGMRSGWGGRAGLACHTRFDSDPGLAPLPAVPPPCTPVQAGDLVLGGPSPPRAACPPPRTGVLICLGCDLPPGEPSGGVGTGAEFNGWRGRDGPKEGRPLGWEDVSTVQRSVPAGSTEGADAAPSPGAQSPRREGRRAAQLRGDTNLGGPAATSPGKPSFPSSTRALPTLAAGSLPPRWPCFRRILTTASGPTADRACLVTL